MIDGAHELPIARQAKVLKHQPRLHLLQSAARVRSGPDVDAAGSMNCIWNTRSREAGCCAIFCTARASR